MIRATSGSAATPDRLWSIASDVERWPDRLPTVTAVRPLGSGPVGVGSRYEVRQPGLPKAVWEMTEWQPGARTFTWISRGPGILSTATHSVTGVDSGSRLDLSLEWTGPLAWLVDLLLRRKSTRMVQTEAETFARLAEHG